MGHPVRRLCYAGPVQRVRQPAVRPGPQPVHVAIIKREYKGKVYSYPLLRQSFREGGKVKHRTLANLSSLPPQVVDLIRAGLAGQHLVPLDQVFRIERSLPHGHVVAVLGSMRKLKMDSLLHLVPDRQRPLVMAMVAARILQPESKLATVGLLQRTGLLLDLGVQTKVDQDDLYLAMDELLGCQEMIERELARRHLKPGDLCLYDRSSATYTGRHCELAARGYSRDGKRNSLQVTFGLTCDKEGRPLAIKVDVGSLTDPQTVAEELDLVCRRFGLKEVILVGDRGLLTKARIEDLRKLPRAGWITALRAPAIQKLVAEGSLQLSLFDLQNLAEISSPEYPNERIIVCYNPAVAEDRARTRAELLAATEKELDKVVQMVEGGRLVEADKIGLRVGKVCNRFKVAKHFELEIARGSFRYRRKQQSIDAEAALDGLYAIRTSVSADKMEAAQVVRSYKQLARVERDFRVIKGPDLEVAPIRHRLVERIRAHFLICQLAAYVRWHMERDLAPLLFKDESPPPDQDPVATARRSQSAEDKARRKRNPEGLPVSSFRSLLDELATLSKNLIAPIGADDARFWQLSQPTPLQDRALQLLGIKLRVAKTPAA
jgi:transposase